MRDNNYTVGFNCTGLRSQESTKRATKSPLWINKGLTGKGNIRLVYDWMPIFHLTEKDVYDTIESAGQKPHAAYGFRGSKNSRLSCIFCIMGSQNDLSNGAKSYPEHYSEIIALENVVNHKMFARSKVIRTTTPMKKGDILEGRKVTKCKILNKRVNGVIQYSNTVCIPVSLSERTGVPVNDVLVAKKTRQLLARKKLLELQRGKEKADKTRIKKGKISATSKRKFQDTKTIDIFEVIG